MDEQTTGDEQQQQTYDSDDEYSIKQTVVIAEDIAFGIDDACTPSEVDLRTSRHIGADKGFIEHITVATCHPEMLVTGLSRGHRTDGVILRIVVQLLRQLEGVLVEEGTIGEDYQFSVFIEQDTEGIGRRFALEHDLRELGERHTDIEGTYDVLTLVDRQTEGGEGFVI